MVGGVRGGVGKEGRYLRDAVVELGVVVWRVWWRNDADDDVAVGVDARLLVEVLCRHLR